VVQCERRVTVGSAKNKVHLAGARGQGPLVVSASFNVLSKTPRSVPLETGKLAATACEASADVID